MGYLLPSRHHQSLALRYLAAVGEGPVFLHPTPIMSSFLRAQTQRSRNKPVLASCSSTPCKAPFTQGPAPKNMEWSFRESVCARTRFVCVWGEEGGEEGMCACSWYDLGSERGSEQPILRDNQAEAAVEAEARLCPGYDHGPTQVPHHHTLTCLRKGDIGESPESWSRGGPGR